MRLLFLLMPSCLRTSSPWSSFLSSTRGERGRLSPGVFAETDVLRRVGSNCGTPLPATALWAACVHLLAVWAGPWVRVHARAQGQGVRMARHVIMFDLMSAPSTYGRNMWWW